MTVAQFLITHVLLPILLVSNFLICADAKAYIWSANFVCSDIERERTHLPDDIATDISSRFHFHRNGASQFFRSSSIRPAEPNQEGLSTEVVDSSFDQYYLNDLLLMYLMAAKYGLIADPAPTSTVQAPVEYHQEKERLKSILTHEPSWRDHIAYTEGLTAIWTGMRTESVETVREGLDLMKTAFPVEDGTRIETWRQQGEAVERIGRRLNALNAGFWLLTRDAIDPDPIAAMIADIRRSMDAVRSMGTVRNDHRWSEVINAETPIEESLTYLNHQMDFLLAAANSPVFESDAARDRVVAAVEAGAFACGAYFRYQAHFALAKAFALSNPDRSKVHAQAALVEITPEKGFPEDQAFPLALRRLTAYLGGTYSAADLRRWF